MTTAVIESIAALRSHLQSFRGAPAAVGLVPTMGALHRGHAELMARARRDARVVVVSIFVNPLQFDRKDDLERYPRTLEADLEICRSLGVDVVFTPAASEMYPSPPECSVSVHRVAEHLCGRFRPGHFDGVATVVLKLFQIVQPDRAYFGEKDAQQLAVIQRMVADFNIPTEIVPVPTIREADGLALSSRNARLSSDERVSALVLYRALQDAAAQIAAGTTDSAAIIATATAPFASNAAVRLEYFDIVEPVNMQPVARVAGRVIVAGAMWVGQTRLIDNIACGGTHTT